MAQGVVVGDAVVKFFADLTDYDQAIAGLNQLPQRLKPAQEAADSLGVSISSVGKAASESADSTSAASAKIATGVKAAGSQAVNAGQQIAQGLGAGLRGAGETSDAIVQLQARIKQLEAELVTLQARFERVGPRASSSMKEARGTLSMLGEDVGIRLPRHLQTFLAGLPGVANAVALGFAPVAVLTLIDVLSKIPEKIAEIEDWLAGFNAAAKAAFEGKASGFISQLQTGIDLLKEETLQQAIAGKSGIDATKGQVAGLSEYQKELSVAIENLQDFQKALDKVKETKVTQLPAPAFGASGGVVPLPTPSFEEETGKAELKEQFQNLVTYAASLQSQFHIYFPVPKLPLDASEKSITEALQKLNKDVSDKITELSNKTAQTEQEKGKLVDDIQKQSLINQAQTLKSGLDRQLATLEEFKEEVRTAYLSGKADAVDWALAQIKATQEATKAHEDYLTKLEALYRREGDSAKVQETAEQLRVFQAQAAAKALAVMNDAIQKETDGIQKLHGELQDASVSGFAKNLEQAAAASKTLQEAQTKLTAAENALVDARKKGDEKQIADATAHLTEVTLAGNAAVQKATKDFEEAEKAAQALATAQKHLQDATQKVVEAEREIAELNTAASYRAQEQEIQRLAQFHIITEQQKERRLKALYEQERNDALAELDKELQERKAKLEQAESAFEAAKDNPIFSAAQKAEAEANLNEALAAYKKTESEKAKIDDQLKQKASGLTSGILQQLQAELRMLPIQQNLTKSQLQLAAAYGLSTSKLEADLAAQRQREKEIPKEIAAINLALRQNTSLVDRWGLDFQNRGKQVGLALTDLAQTGKTALDGLASAFENSVAQAELSEASFGTALRKGVAEVLASVSAKAAIQALYETAEGFALLAVQDYQGASDAFTAAALYGGVAVGAGIAAYEINPKSQSSSGQSQGSSAVDIGANGQAGAAPSTGVNAPKLFRGGIVEKPGFAYIGDAKGGGDAVEAVLPLEDQRANQRIADAILGPMIAAFSGVRTAQIGNFIPPELFHEIVHPQNFTRATLRAGAEAVSLGSESSRSRPQTAVHHHSYDQRTTVQVDMHIKGAVSADTLDKLAPQMAKSISKHVRRGTVRLDASTSHRTRKSQIKR